MQRCIAVQLSNQIIFQNYQHKVDISANYFFHCISFVRFIVLTPGILWWEMLINLLINDYVQRPAYILTLCNYGNIWNS